MLPTCFFLDAIPICMIFSVQANPLTKAFARCFALALSNGCITACAPRYVADSCMCTATDGALYGQQFKGTTVADICPRTCHRCPGQDPLPSTDASTDGAAEEGLEAVQDMQQAAATGKGEL